MECWSLIIKTAYQLQLNLTRNYRTINEKVYYQGKKGEKTSKILMTIPRILDFEKYNNRSAVFIVIEAQIKHNYFRSF